MPESFLCPRLVKMDVEGMEFAVLKGAQNTISRCRPIIYAENNCVRDSSNLIRILISEYNMRVVWDLQPYFNLDNYQKNRVDIFPSGFLAVNILAVPAEEDIGSAAMESIKKRVEIKSSIGYTLEPYQDAVLKQLTQVHKHFVSFVGEEMLRFRVAQAGNETHCKR